MMKTVRRLYNYEPVTPLRTLRASVFGRLVCVKGTVVRVSNIRPLCTRMAFSCLGCSQTQSLPLQHGKYAIPTKVWTHSGIFSVLCFHNLVRRSDTVSIQFPFAHNNLWHHCLDLEVNFSRFMCEYNVFYHSVYPARLSQSFLQPQPEFSSYSDCRLADHQVSTVYYVPLYSRAATISRLVDLSISRKLIPNNWNIWFKHF